MRLDRVTGFYDYVAEAAPELPVVKGELNPVFAGCYSSHADVKLLNRRGENALSGVEALAAVAALTAEHGYPHADFERLWRTVLFQGFHDILCGCGIGLTSKTAHEWAEPAIEEAHRIASGAMTASRSAPGGADCVSGGRPAVANPDVSAKFTSKSSSSAGGGIT